MCWWKRLRASRGDEPSDNHKYRSRYREILQKKGNEAFANSLHDPIWAKFHDESDGKLDVQESFLSLRAIDSTSEGDVQ